ncbi:MAG: hypothetical protein ACRD9L_24085 [Bryobacteraceae bacterium]
MKSPARKVPVSRRKSEQGGFALLLIFLLAACVGIFLYMQLPRSAFEAQRIKEQLLMERGYEYQRAVQLYFRKFKHYPQKIEDLENTSDIRFLRRRYKDPMTGKDEWRILHMGPAGYLTDSLVDKPPTPNGEKAKDGLGGTSSPTGASAPDTAAAEQQIPGQGPQPVSGALIRRPSDTAASAIGTAGAQRPQNPNQPNDPNQPYDPNQALAQQTAAASPYGNQPYNSSQPYNPIQPTNANQPNNPNQPYNGRPTPPGMPPGVPGQFPSISQFPGAPGNAQPPATIGATQQPFGAQPQQPGAPQPGPGATPGASPNAAIGLINQLLTTPRQPPAGMNAGNTSLEMQGGIAGVASKDADIGIMRYHDRKKYNEWEFVYDYKKDRTLGAVAGTGAPQAPPSGPGAGGSQSGFGQSSFGQSSFGQSSTGQSSSGFTMGTQTPPTSQQSPTSQ